MEAVADLGAAFGDAGGSTSDRGRDQLWNTDAAWELCDETLQIRGGRGCERSLASRAKPYHRADAARSAHQPDLRRHEPGDEAVHRARARRPLEGRGRRRCRACRWASEAGLLRAGLFYAWWYPSRWFGWGHAPLCGVRIAGGHVLDRADVALARQQFHLMVLHGPALERRQALLFRCVDAARVVRDGRDVRAGTARHACERLRRFTP